MSLVKGQTMATLIGDTDTGEGSIYLAEDFRRQSLVMQMDLLRDWIGMLQEEAESVHEALYEHGMGAGRKSP